MGKQRCFHPWIQPRGPSGVLDTGRCGHHNSGTSSLHRLRTDAHQPAPPSSWTRDATILRTLLPRNRSYYHSLKSGYDALPTDHSVEDDPTGEMLPMLQASHLDTIADEVSGYDPSKLSQAQLKEKQAQVAAANLFFIEATNLDSPSWTTAGMPDLSSEERSRMEAGFGSDVAREVPDWLRYEPDA